MNAFANPQSFVQAVQSVSGGKGMETGKVQPADMIQAQLHGTVEQASPSQESAFHSMVKADAIGGPDIHSDIQVQAATPELRAQAPSEPNQILNDLGGSLQHTTSQLSHLEVPALSAQNPDISSTMGKEFSPEAFQKIGDQMMKQQRELFSGVFEANEKLQSATLSETVIVNSSTQAESSFKKVMNGQGG